MGLNEKHEVDEVSIALHYPGSLQPVLRTPAVGLVPGLGEDVADRRPPWIGGPKPSVTETASRGS